MAKHWSGPCGVEINPEVCNGLPWAPLSCRDEYLPTACAYCGREFTLRDNIVFVTSPMRMAFVLVCVDCEKIVMKVVT